MLPGNDATFGIALGWLALCVVAWARVYHWRSPWILAHPRVFIAAAAAVARVVPALTIDRGLFFDIEAHWWIGSLVLAGRNVYRDPLAVNRYPYPPLHGYISALMVWLADGSRAAFLVTDKLIPAACGVGIAVAVWAIARRLDLAPLHAIEVGLLYALNPLPVLVTSYHGQFEEIPLLFIVLALLAMSGTRQTGRAVVLSALLLGVAVAYKTWPLLFLPPLFLLVQGWGRRLGYALVTLVPLALSVGLYGLAFGRSGAREALHGMLSYSGAANFCWGYVAVVHPCWISRQNLRPNSWIFTVNDGLLVVAMTAVGLLLLWRRRPLEGLVTIPLAFYLFAPGWGPNYSVWILPFALLLTRPLARRYTVVMLPVVALIYVDSLYASYERFTFSWAVLKPLEAGLGLVAWCGLAVLLLQVYQRRWWRLAQPRPTEVVMAVPDTVTAPQ